MLLRERLIIHFEIIILITWPYFFSYQETIDDVKEKGREQIRKYESTNQAIRETIEQQLDSVQDSYDSLLKTANQIRARLENSLLKFQEYEDILSSIWSNLEELETSINSEIDEPEELGKAKILLESMRVKWLKMFVHMQT